MKRSKVFGLAVGLVMVGGVVGASSASAHTGPHLHGITAGNGETHVIAGGLCHAPWDIAGDNFHHNVHVGGPDLSSGAPAISITSAGACP
jgi:hypothetical protein